MAENTVRTIAIFGVITLVLLGAAVGGVFLMKARNNSYAAAQKPPVAQTNQPTAQPEQKKDEAKKDQPAAPQNNQNQQQNPAPASNPAPAKPNPQPAQTPTPANNPPGATPNGSMPATGPEDMLLMIPLLMLAVFFGGKLLRARADYRRYVGS